ncbi:hypothetical protein PAPYR_7820 [Paratrimastix pyriformis]|uniref:Tyrosine-protein kinase ephrin type A/B receptor-like domain-containing protein n=1 Tax=Paratrimastix pyriformis TaxID=342808 RepID=A0ABQ8UHI0_9EUKA|nr:hypothetical protein PAPYR_7820 [Paratrimastix pyriformis]
MWAVALLLVAFSLGGASGDTANTLLGDVPNSWQPLAQFEDSPGMACALFWDNIVCLGGDRVLATALSLENNTFIPIPIEVFYRKDHLIFYHGPELFAISGIHSAPPYSPESTVFMINTRSQFFNVLPESQPLPPAAQSYTAFDDAQGRSIILFSPLEDRAFRLYILGNAYGQAVGSPVTLFYRWTALPVSAPQWGAYQYMKVTSVTAVYHSEALLVIAAYESCLVVKAFQVNESLWCGVFSPHADLTPHALTPATVSTPPGLISPMTPNLQITSVQGTLCALTFAVAARQERQSGTLGFLAGGMGGRVVLFRLRSKTGSDSFVDVSTHVWEPVAVDVNISCPAASCALHWQRTDTHYILVASPGSPGANATFWRYTDRPAPAVCPQGKRALGDYCIACPPGSVGLPDGTCEECPPGSTAWGFGSLECAPCPFGTYQPDPSGGMCLPCPAGSKAPQLRSTACIPCTEAEYCPVGTGVPRAKHELFEGHTTGLTEDPLHNDLGSRGRTNPRIVGEINSSYWYVFAGCLGLAAALAVSLVYGLVPRCCPRWGRVGPRHGCMPRQLKHLDMLFQDRHPTHEEGYKLQGQTTLGGFGSVFFLFFIVPFVAFYVLTNLYDNATLTAIPYLRREPFEHYGYAIPADPNWCPEVQNVSIALYMDTYFWGYAGPCCREGDFCLSRSDLLPIVAAKRSDLPDVKTKHSNPRNHTYQSKKGGSYYDQVSAFACDPAIEVQQNAALYPAPDWASTAHWCSKVDDDGIWREDLCYVESYFKTECGGQELVDRLMAWLQQNVKHHVPISRATGGVSAVYMSASMETTKCAPKNPDEEYYLYSAVEVWKASPLLDRVMQDGVEAAATLRLQVRSAMHREFRMLGAENDCIVFPELVWQVVPPRYNVPELLLEVVIPQFHRRNILNRCLDDTFAKFSLGRARYHDFTTTAPSDSENWFNTRTSVDFTAEFACAYPRYIYYCPGGVVGYHIYVWEDPMSVMVTVSEKASPVTIFSSAASLFMSLMGVVGVITATLERVIAGLQGHTRSASVCGRCLRRLYAPIRPSGAATSSAPLEAALETPPGRASMLLSAFPTTGEADAAAHRQQLTEPLAPRV